jgi:hypothetical protein
MAKKEKWKNTAIDREEEEFNRRVRARHIELFPEEYDHMFDSFSDARERQKGRSPMNLDNLARANESRMVMGFEPLSETGSATSRDTYRFVEERMRAGEDVRREGLISDNSEAEAKADQRREIAPKGSSAGSMLDQRIDSMLAGNAFIYEDQDRSDPRVIAFRVLGELFELNRSGDNEPELLSQIRRLLPARPETEYQNLYRYAMNEWMEAYGF